MAKWQGRGLQNPDRRFESGRRLQNFRYENGPTGPFFLLSEPTLTAKLTAKRRQEERLARAERGRPPFRFPLADYIARRMPGFFDLLIVDEQHEYKARGSAQGLAAGTLAEACRRVLTLTGTLMGGYSSTLFYLLWRFSPAVRDEFAYRDEQRWVARYGIVERITRKGDDDPYEDGRVSRRRGYRTRVVEKPGVSPAVLFHLIGNTAFLRPADVAAGLPEYREEVRLVGLEGGDGSQEASQAAYYHRLAGQLEAAVRQVLAGAPRAGAARATGEGRRVLVYITHTATRDISPRLESVLRGAGFRVATLKSDTVSADRREEWVERRVKEGLDVLLVHPRLVQTGLDLIQFATICWYEVEYSVYTMRQASRRSWRIGQRLPVQVVYFAYRGTLQAQALALVAKKLQSSLAVEGELVEEGLAAHGDEGDDLLMALARSLTERVEASEDSLEGLFAGVRQTEQEIEAALRPDDMTPEEPEPEPDPTLWLMPEREDGDLGALIGLPLFQAAVGEAPSRNGDRPEAPAPADEPVAEERAAAAVVGSESGADETPPTEGQQLRLL